LKDNRRPALFTGNFGDCMGSSSINVTRFDAAYYKDNMTVSFHLQGNTALTNESLMMYIGVYAYGENRFELTFNPCSANIDSLCPTREDVPIEANGIIPIAKSDVANIPPIALTIPDFEGEAILRIFANSTQQQIGCFSAVVTNGATFSQVATVGTILGLFTIVAIIASFATAIYGNNIPEMRKHYAHSMSVMVVFAVFHHIFFTGALSMNWPSVLVAFWSNYAWSAGMIYTSGMQNSINKFIGSNIGNTSSVGAAGVGSQNPDLGGGYDIRKIYARNIDPLFPNHREVIRMHAEKFLRKRAIANSTDGFNWYGKPLPLGLPLPGNFSGFAGTLAQHEIPASNAFLTGLIWLAILIVIITGSIATFKFILEGLIRTRFVKNDRLLFFRSHWLGYVAFAVLRICFVAFFMMMFLTMFQFTYSGGAGPLAIAAIVFILFFVGMFGVAAYACYYPIRFGGYKSKPDRINLERRRLLGVVPWYRFVRESHHRREDSTIYAGSIPFFSFTLAEGENEKSIHDDDAYTKKFGWLASRFRRTRWWFFSAWLFYEFIRACFFAGASGHPMIQVFGLLVVEFLAFLAIVVLRPFEGQRLNAIVVYLLGFSKVATVALSAAFDNEFRLARIPTTAIGIVIIVIQGILTIVLLIAIALGAISSYWSVMRNREVVHPRAWIPLRDRYFKHLDTVVADVPPPPPQPVVPEEPKEPYFAVTSIRRVAKIEDEDPDLAIELGSRNASRLSLPSGAAGNEAGNRQSRANSIRSTISYHNVPFGARVHRASWNSRDF
ncbi:TRP-domain-containing protein, partial [Patellaria atrata CBS 101060]